MDGLFNKNEGRIKDESIFFIIIDILLIFNLNNYKQMKLQYSASGSNL